MSFKFENQQISKQAMKLAKEVNTSYRDIMVTLDNADNDKLKEQLALAILKLECEGHRGRLRDSVFTRVYGVWSTLQTRRIKREMLNYARKNKAA